jgi:hypothetical protein
MALAHPDEIVIRFVSVLSFGSVITLEMAMGLRITERSIGVSRVVVLGKCSVFWSLVMMEEVLKRGEFEGILQDYKGWK